jgi:hypothetical protein
LIPNAERSFEEEIEEEEDTKTTKKQDVPIPGSILAPELQVRTFLIFSAFSY